MTRMNGKQREWKRNTMLCVVFVLPILRGWLVYVASLLWLWLHNAQSTPVPPLSHITHEHIPPTQQLPHPPLALKVHKNESFFCFDFEFCTIKILQKKLFDWASIGEGTIFPRSPRTTRNEKNFWARSKTYFFIFLFMNPLYELILVFRNSIH